MDLDPEHVRLLLKQQGYAVPDEDLLEITASLNALVEGMADLSRFGPLQEEPWPILVDYLGEQHAG